MEEKKKKTQTKKKNTNNKKTSSKKVVAKKKTTKKTTPKKPTTKTASVKKEAPKKVEKPVEEIKEAPKKVEKPVEEIKEEKETKEELALEKTIIFDSKQKRNLQEVVDRLEEENVVVDDKVIKRSKVRKILIIIIAIAMVLIFAASIAYVASQLKIEHHKNETTGSNIYEKAKAKKVEPSEKIEEKQTEEQYKHIITIDLNQFETKAANKDEMIVLVASSSCSSCIQFEPDVEKVFAELDKEIYRIDIKTMSDEEINDFREYYAFTITPTIFVVKDGVVVADTARTGRMTVEDLKEWLNKNS